MNYKTIDNEENLCTIQGIYDKYQLIMGNVEYINSSQLNKEEFNQTCEKFEVVISVYSDEEKVDKLKDRNLGIHSEDDYYNRLDELLSELNYFAIKLPINLIERNFISLLFFQRLSDYFQITEDEKNNDPNDFQQDMLETALKIIYNCATRSQKLSKAIIDYGILIKIQKNIDYYNDICKHVCYSIFSVFFHNKYEVGQVYFRDFVKNLAEKFITEKNYDLDELKTSQISELLFSFNGYGVVHDDEEEDKKYHEFASEKAFLILDKKLGNCMNSALKGINDLIVSCDWFFFEKKELIKDIYKLLNNETDDNRIRYLTQILGNLYEKLSNLDKNDEQFEYFYTKFNEVTFDEENKKCILGLIRDANEFTLKLYSLITHLFNDFIDSFADQDFLGNLYDCLDNGTYKIKIQILNLLTDFLLISNTNSAFFNAFFDQEFSLISEIYIASLVLFDPEADYFNFILKGILIAFDKNPDLVNRVLHKCEDFEDLMKISPLDEEQHHLLNEIFIRYNA